MLTKEEREETAERLGKLKYIDSDGLYKSIVGKDMPQDTPASEDDRVILDRLIDLCDTSNMVELPLDKDGKVIKVGDTVYSKNMGKCRVTSIEYTEIDSVCIHCFAVPTFGVVSYLPNQLTHTPISETEQIAKAIKNFADTFNEQLREFADYMGSLGDNND